jgi:hypothetical protein
MQMFIESRVLSNTVSYGKSAQRCNIDILLVPIHRIMRTNQLVGLFWETNKLWFSVLTELLIYASYSVRLPWSLLSSYPNKDSYGSSHVMMFLYFVQSPRSNGDVYCDGLIGRRSRTSVM